MAAFNGKLADPEFRKRRAKSGAALANSPQARVRSLARSAAAADDIDAWAERIAASLPPLEPDEIAAIGRLAAVLDARRASAEAEGGQ